MISGTPPKALKKIIKNACKRAAIGVKKNLKAVDMSAKALYSNIIS
jgi:hypothetical protein